ncbi:hypothetical protein D1BOALGB6SA_7292 [Olavius sp. associated proteobacterium Delta 1]|nr:hypothetical protein D1BOALGB6SA_7292 [Olavius sp. associated proteobacterium Delta 1]
MNPHAGKRKVLSLRSLPNDRLPEFCANSPGEIRDQFPANDLQR